MADCVRAIVTGFAISMAIPAIYYFDKAVLVSLVTANKEIGKALVRIIRPSETRYVALKHTCDKADCTIVCCCCGRDHHSCYNCDVEKLELNP